MRRRRLSVEVRAEIAARYLFSKKSMKQLAEMYNVSTSTVHDIVKKKNLYGTVADRPRTGRPKLSDVRDDRRLVLLSLKNRFQTAGQLRHLWHIRASTSTVQRRLLAASLRGCVAKTKPPLTALHRKMRLEWCRARRNWTVEQWREVVFVDESAFSLFPNTMRVHVRRRKHESYSSACISPSLKWRSPKVMVWGAISGAGVGPLHRAIGNINQFEYQAILDTHEEYLIGCTLAQDNAPIHRTALIRDWMTVHGVEVLPWPSCSPDLNPIEQVWAVMKRRVQGQRFKNKDELVNTLNEMWSQFSTRFIRLFVDSMPRRVKAVIAAKGGATRY